MTFGGIILSSAGLIFVVFEVGCHEVFVLVFGDVECRLCEGSILKGIACIVRRWAQTGFLLRLWWTSLVDICGPKFFVN